MTTITTISVHQAEPIVGHGAYDTRWLKVICGDNGPEMIWFITAETAKRLRAELEPLTQEQS